jgi:WhiB family transcriptional regulator, redox-sensing transcriptional regulator
MLADLFSVNDDYEERTIDWSLARCKDGVGSMTALFFSEQIDDIARAKQICTLCPVQEACLECAIARREPWGVWGGQLFFNGKILAQKRKRGRPPKNPQVAQSA